MSTRNRPGPERRRRIAAAAVQGRLRISLVERERMVAELERGLAAIAVVEDHLWVAQQRSGETLSPRTWAQVEAVREGLSDLRAKVVLTPLTAE
jgi:hypothetical protein